jgi:hypothetical protein
MEGQLEKLGENMAGEWIKVRTNLWDDPRVSQLCDLTSSIEATVVGGLYWLWSTADEHTETGLMPGMSAAAIDRKTGIRGFGAALVSIGWLRETPEGVIIERFEEHNGKSAKTRAQTAKRVANHAAKEGANADSVSDALAREEKRREEIDKSTDSGTKKGKSAARGTRLPTDWKPSPEDVAYCKTERPDLLPSLVAQNFFDYWTAKSGQAATKVDWSATWRSWVRKERTENAPRPPAVGGNVVGFPGGPRAPVASQAQANTDEAKRLLGFDDNEGAAHEA